jgi:hypothetical protein
MATIARVSQRKAYACPAGDSADAEQHMQGLEQGLPTRGKSKGESPPCVLLFDSIRLHIQRMLRDCTTSRSAWQGAKRTIAATQTKRHRQPTRAVGAPLTTQRMSDPLGGRPVMAPGLHCTIPSHGAAAPEPQAATPAQTASRARQAAPPARRRRAPSAPALGTRPGSAPHPCCSPAAAPQSSGRRAPPGTPGSGSGRR